MTTRRRATAAWMAAVVVATGAGVFAGRATLTPPPAVVEAAPVPTYTVEETTVGRSSTFQARATWPTRDLAFATEDGTVTSVEASPGAPVAAGSVLYRLDLRPVVIAQGDTPAFRALAQGDRGPDVTQLQQLLIDLGHSRAQADGRFSARTTTAVKAWQRSLGVEATGVVGDGDLVFAPVLPARVVLGEDVAIGRRLMAGDLTVQVVTAEPDITITVDGNSEIPTPGAGVTVTYAEHAWTGVVGDAEPASGDRTGTVVRLLAEDGRPVCADGCGHIDPTASVGHLAARVETVASASGPVVPVSALGSDAVGGTFVVARDGTRREVTVVVTDGSRAVVEGVVAGEVIHLFAAAPDAEPVPEAGPTSGAAAA